jgi:hypothetical protein
MPRGPRDREDTAKELAIPERGIRRIIRLGSTYHTLDLSNTDDGTEYEPYLSPNAASLRALLAPLGVAMEGLALQHEHVHTLVLVLSDAQVQTFFRPAP